MRNGWIGDPQNANIRTVILAVSRRSPCKVEFPKYCKNDDGKWVAWDYAEDWDEDKGDDRKPKPEGYGQQGSAARQQRESQWYDSAISLI